MTALLLAGASCATAPQQSAPQGHPGHSERCDHSFGFVADAASGKGGKSTPIEAARWFAAHGGMDAPLPIDGWHVVGRQGKQVTLRSGTAWLRAVQWPDETWKVDFGHGC